MTFRDMVEITLRAVNGEHVGVLSYDEKDAKRGFTKYVEWLATTTYDKWKAVAHVGKPKVIFDGGGTIWFITPRQHIDGVELYERKWDEMPYLRGEDE